MSYKLISIAPVVAEDFKKSGMTRKQLATELGISRPQVDKMLRGDTEFSLKRLYDLGRILKRDYCLLPAINYQDGLKAKDAELEQMRQQLQQAESELASALQETLQLKHELELTKAQLGVYQKLYDPKDSKQG